MSRPFNITMMKESVMGTEGKRWEVLKEYSHLFLVITSWLKGGKNEELGSLWGKGPEKFAND